MKFSALCINKTIFSQRLPKTPTKCFRKHNNSHIFTADPNIYSVSAFSSSPPSVNLYGNKKHLNSLSRIQTPSTCNAYHNISYKILAESQPPTLRYMASSLASMKQIQVLQQQQQHRKKIQPYTTNVLLRQINYQYNQNHQNYKREIKKLKQSAVQNYLLAVNPHLISQNSVQHSLKTSTINPVNIAHTFNKSWHKAGKYSYVRGRCVTGGGHLVSNLCAIVSFACKVAAENAIATSSGIEGAALLHAAKALNISYLSGQALYKIIGESYAGHKRFYNKCYEEVNSNDGFPKINTNLAQTKDIASNINTIKDLIKKLPQLIQNIQSTEQQINNVKKQLKQCSNEESQSLQAIILNIELKCLQKKYSVLQNKTQEYLYDIKNFEAARAREKIEFKGNKTTIKINSIVTCINVALSLIASASIIYAPPLALPIKIGAGAISFIATLGQYFCNSFLSGKNLSKKYNECIYQNLKSTFEFDLQDLNLNKIAQMEKDYQKKRRQTHNRHHPKNTSSKNIGGDKIEMEKMDVEINKLDLDYEKALKAEFKQTHIQNLSNGWQKPIIYRLNNAIQYLNVIIHKKLDALYNLRSAQIQYKNKLLYKDEIQNLVDDLRNLMLDLKNIYTILDQAKYYFKISIPSNDDYIKCSEKIAKQLTKITSPIILNSLTNNDCALELMMNTKKEQVNDPFKDLASYSAPGAFTSILSALTIGGIYGADANLDNFNVEKRAIPVSGILSLLNHSQVLANSSNRAEGEYVKKYTKDLINEHNQKKTTPNTNQEFIYKTSTEDISIKKSIDNFLSDMKDNDEFIQNVYQSKNILLKNEAKKKSIRMPIDRDKVHAKKQNFSSAESKCLIYGDMMIGGTKHAINYHIRSKNYHEEIQKIHIELQEKYTCMMQFQV
jgi:hypothetical protein